MKRILAWWHRMQVEHYRREAGRAALALLLAPREETDRHRVREYFRHVTARLAGLQRRAP